MKKKKWNKILAVFLVIMTAILLLNAFNEDRKKGWNVDDVVNTRSAKSISCC